MPSTEYERYIKFRQFFISILSKTERIFTTEFTYSDSLLIEIFRRTEKDLTRIDNPNLFKIAGFYSFWFRKIKPVQATYHYRFINEILAVTLATGLLRKYRNWLGNEYKNNICIPENTFKDIVYSMRYRTFSPHTWVLLLEANFRK